MCQKWCSKKLKGIWQFSSEFGGNHLASWFYMEHSSLHHLLILPNTKELRKCVVCADGGPLAEEILPFSQPASCQQAIRFWSCLISLQRHRLYNNLLGAFGQVRQLHEKKKSVGLLSQDIPEIPEMKWNSFVEGIDQNGPKADTGNIWWWEMLLLLKESL